MGQKKKVAAGQKKRGKKARRHLQGRKGKRDSYPQKARVR